MCSCLLSQPHPCGPGPCGQCGVWMEQWVLGSEESGASAASIRVWGGGDVTGPLQPPCSRWPLRSWVGT